MTTLLDTPYFYFLRHGETGANVLDLVSGATDDPLTRDGEAQAEAAAQLLKDHAIASIWYSPLSRARRTAEAVARQTGAPLFALDGLAERHWGEWEGKPRDVLVREEKPRGGEGPEEFEARVWAAVAQITGPFPVLIVGHSGTARALHARLCDSPYSRAENAVPYRFEKATGRHWNIMKLS